MDLSGVSAILALANSAFSTLKGATDVAADLKSLTGPSTDPQVHDLVLKLYGQLIDARSQQLEMQTKLHEMAAELRRIDEFDEAAKRYALTQTPGKAFVYALADLREGDVAHTICPACFQERRFSILQISALTEDRCPRCGAEFCVRRFDPSMLNI